MNKKEEHFFFSIAEKLNQEPPLFYEITKKTFEDKRLNKYISILLNYYYNWCFSDLLDDDNIGESIKEIEVELKKIDEIILRTEQIILCKDHQISDCFGTGEALSDMHLMWLFVTLAAFDGKSNKNFVEYFCNSLIEQVPLEKVIFESKCEKMLKDSHYQIDNLKQSISELSDENEKLGERIERSKIVWEENKKLHDENQQLKLELEKYKKTRL